ncbi:MAG: single-stranded DNA-binding protein [bacterium]
MNTWNFTGNLGKDCEVKTTQSGSTLCEFSVGVSSGYGDKQKTTWANCVIFGKRAEGKLPEHLTKGQKVAISGELTQETWQKTDGGTGFKLKVVVNSMDLIGVREQQSAPAQQPQQRAPQPARQPAPQQQAPNAAGAPQQPVPYQQNYAQAGPDVGDGDNNVPFENPYKNMEYLV